MSFDLASLDTRIASDEGVWLTLLDISGKDVLDDEGAPVQFKLIGRDSAVAKEAFGEVAGKEGGALSAASVNALAKCVKGWSDNLTMGGKAFEYSEENARTLAAVPHIQGWIASEVVNRANFTPPK